MKDEEKIEARTEGQWVATLLYGKSSNVSQSNFAYQFVCFWFGEKKLFSLCL